jgi:hypothetical protein
LAFPRESVRLDPRAVPAAPAEDDARDFPDAPVVPPSPADARLRRLSAKAEAA